MKEEHVSDLLSAYLDKALKPSERKRVAKHISGCKRCSLELDDLKKVAGLVSALPEKELPKGFMKRLEARRRTAAEIGDVKERPAPKPAPAAWLPVPPRSLALAAVALLVMVVCFRQVRYRLAPGLLSQPMVLEESDERADAALKQVEDALGRKQDAGAGGGFLSGVDFARGGASGSAARLASSRKRTTKAKRRAPGRPIGVTDSAPESSSIPYEPEREGAAGKSAMMAPAASPSPAARAPAKKERQLKGPKLTNLQLADRLVEERKRMGIQKIVPPRRDSHMMPVGGRVRGGRRGGEDIWNKVGQDIPQQPMDRAQAMDAMRLMTRRLARMNEQYRWQTRPTVPLGAGSTPALLAKRKASKPLAEADKADDEAASPDSTEMLARRREKKTAGSKDAKAHEMVRPIMPEEAKPKPPKPIQWTRQWTASRQGLALPGGAVIRRQDYWEQMWKEFKFAPSLPKIDFEKNMIVAVFADRPIPAEKAQTIPISMSIVSITRESGGMIIRYRVNKEAPPKPPKSAVAYHITVVPRNELPFRFIQVQ